MALLCWNVYIGDFNSGEIKEWNVFNHWAFYDDCVKAKKKFKKDKEAFAKEIRSSLMYYFWSKCEWEIILDHWPSGEHYNMRKIFTLEEMHNDLKYPEDKLLGAPDRRFEVRVFPEHNRYKVKKIDAYDQVMNNWERFIDYLWENRDKLKEKK